jgi:hypothetical protein
MYDSYTQSIKERYLVLRGRIVLICKKKGKRCLSWKGATGLNSRKDIAVVSDSSYKVPNVEFRIYGPERTLIFFAPTVYERDMWVHEMQQSIS